MKKKSKITSKIKSGTLFCPKCKSTNLNFMPWLGLIYECRDCGWRGPVVVGKRKKLSRSRSV